MDREDKDRYWDLLGRIANERKRLRIASQAKPSEACFWASALLMILEGGPEPYRELFGMGSLPPTNRQYSMLPEIWRKKICHKSGRFDYVAGDLLRWLLVCHRVFAKHQRHLVRSGNTVNGFKTTLPYCQQKLGYSVPQLRGAYKRLAKAGLLTYKEDRLKDVPCYLVKLDMERIVEITLFDDDDDVDDEAETLEDDLEETEKILKLEQRQPLEPKATPDHRAARSATPKDDNRKDNNMPPLSAGSLGKSVGWKSSKTSLNRSQSQPAPGPLCRSGHSSESAIIKKPEAKPSATLEHVKPSPVGVPLQSLRSALKGEKARKSDLFLHLWREIIERGGFKGPRSFPDDNDRQAVLNFFTVYPDKCCFRLATIAALAWHAISAGGQSPACTQSLHRGGIPWQLQRHRGRVEAGREVGRSLPRHSVVLPGRGTRSNGLSACGTQGSLPERE